LTTSLYFFAELPMRLRSVTRMQLSKTD
jgi:hypothetical protein